MDSLTYTQIANPNDEQLSAIINGLDAFGLQQLGGDAPIRVAIICSHPGGGVIGGAVGHSLRRRFYLTQLWVTTKHRSKGVGTDLVRRMESTALAHGCRDIVVDTLNNHAVRFYERLGYQVYMTNKNYIREFDWCFLSKELPHYCSY